MFSQSEIDASNTNLVLAALSRQDYERLTSRMTLVRIPLNKIVYCMGDQLRYAYFINSGMVSILSVSQTGSCVAVGMVGREGILGIPIILGMDETPYEMSVQLQVSSAWRIRAEDFREEFNRGGKFQELLLKYTYVTITQLSQSALCHHFHSAEERLSHWLLVTRDRLNSNTIPLTQEIIARMLGVPRTGITLTAGNLQREGLIRYSRGKITIVDSAKLEALACECYEVTKDNLNNYVSRVIGNLAAL